MNIASIKDRLLGKFRSRKYRRAFAEADIATTIAAQIFALREKSGWTQNQLADKVGMAQARISVLENPDYRRFSIRTLLRVAAAFDVGLIVRFVPFSEIIRWNNPLAVGLESLAPSSYEEDARRFRSSEPSRLQVSNLPGVSFIAAEKAPGISVLQAGHRALTEPPTADSIVHWQGGLRNLRTSTGSPGFDQKAEAGEKQMPIAA